MPKNLSFFLSVLQGAHPPMVKLNEFNTFANLMNGKLWIDEKKFLKNSLQRGIQYWTCCKYIKLGCRARAQTKVINGYAMLKITNGKHNH